MDVSKAIGVGLTTAVVYSYGMYQRNAQKTIKKTPEPSQAKIITPDPDSVADKILYEALKKENEELKVKLQNLSLPPSPDVEPSLDQRYADAQDQINSLEDQLYTEKHKLHRILTTIHPHYHLNYDNNYDLSFEDILQELITMKQEVTQTIPIYLQKIAHLEEESLESSNVILHLREQLTKHRMVKVKEIMEMIAKSLQETELHQQQEEELLNRIESLEKKLLKILTASKERITKPSYNNHHSNNNNNTSFDLTDDDALSHLQYQYHQHPADHNEQQQRQHQRQQLQQQQYLKQRHLKQQEASQLDDIDRELLSNRPPPLSSSSSSHPYHLKKKTTSSSTWAPTSSTSAVAADDDYDDYLYHDCLRSPFPVAPIPPSTSSTAKRSSTPNNASSVHYSGYSLHSSSQQKKSTSNNNATSRQATPQKKSSSRSTTPNSLSGRQSSQRSYASNDQYNQDQAASLLSVRKLLNLRESLERLDYEDNSS